LKYCANISQSQTFQLIPLTLILAVQISNMVSELGFSDALSSAQTIGIVGTMVLALLEKTNTSTIK